MSIEALITSASPDELFSVILLLEEAAAMGDTIWDVLGPAFMTLEDVLVTDYNWQITVNKQHVVMGPMGQTVEFQDDVLLSKTQALLGQIADTNNLRLPSRTLCCSRVQLTLQDIFQHVNVDLSDAVVRACATPHLVKTYNVARNHLSRLAVDEILKQPSLCTPAEKALWSSYFAELSKCLAYLRTNPATFTPAGPVGKITTVAGLIGAAWDGDAIIPMGKSAVFSDHEKFMVELAVEKYKLVLVENPDQSFATRATIDPFLCVSDVSQDLPKLTLVASFTASELPVKTQPADVNVFWDKVSVDLNSDPDLLHRVTAGGLCAKSVALWATVPQARKKLFARFVPTNMSTFPEICAATAAGMGVADGPVWADVCAHRLIAIKGNLVVDLENHHIKRRH